MAVRPGRKLTYEDFVRFPDDGIRREIVDGEAYVTSAANARHQRLVGHIFYALYDHVRRHGGGEVFVSPLDVLLGEHDIVQPDVLFVADARLDVVTPMNIKGTPTLAVEVASDPRHDRIRKRNLYERAGIAAYWIIDPDADRVEVYRLSRKRYPKPAILEPGDTLTLDELPGFSLDPSELFSL